MKSRNKKGIILILAYSIIASLIVLSGAAVFRAVHSIRLAERNKLSTQALYIAEAGLEEAVYTLNRRIADSFGEDEPDPGQEYFSANVSDFLSSGFNIGYSCVAVDEQKDDSGTLARFIKHYYIESEANKPNKGVSVTLSQIVRSVKTYTFQHAVFYNDDLEMIPGPDMTLSGRIHSNNDIYLATHNTFTIDTDYLHSCGGIFNKRKDDGSRLAGDVKIEIKDTSPVSYDYIEKSGEYLDSDHPDWETESQTRWNGTVKSSVHGVTSLATPVVGSVKPDGYYADRAGLKVVKTSSGDWEIYSGTTQIDRSSFPEDPISESVFEDKRENKLVTVTDIDISKLNQSESFTDANGNGSYDAGESFVDSNGDGGYTSSYFPSNGLLYMSREDAAPSLPNGVRLKNGDELASGLTVVSDGPVYIQGDYNSTDKKPAAVICDAVNILSNNWDDSNNNFWQRNADNTSINCAFISGIVPTPDGGGNYSGGLENYPRLHENWSGRVLSIRGSFVELWESQIAQGNWDYGSPVYKAPGRDWDYDTDFNDKDKLPPFTPFAVEAERVLWQKGKIEIAE